jgi:hypothetical protein
MSYLPELRNSLVRAAERRHRTAAEGAPPPGERRSHPRSWLGLRAVPAILAGAVALGIAAFALVALGHGRAPSRTPPAHPLILGPSTAPPLPHLPPADFWLIIEAQMKAARHPDCPRNVSSAPAISYGSPSRKLLSLLGALRRPPIPADSAARALVERSLAAGAGEGPGLEVYIRYIRLARVLNGVSYFIVPAGDVIQFGPSSARCDAAQATALRQLVHGRPKLARALPLQAEYLRWQRYQATHTEGVFVVEMSAAGHDFSGNLTTADIEAGAVSGPSSETSGYIFYSVVPDGVAAITMRFPRDHERSFSPVTAAVGGNVYVLTPPPRAFYPSQIIWRGADGRVIRTFQAAYP